MKILIHLTFLAAICLFATCKPHAKEPEITDTEIPSVPLTKFTLKERLFLLTQTFPSGCQFNLFLDPVTKKIMIEYEFEESILKTMAQTSDSLKIMNWVMTHYDGVIEDFVMDTCSHYASLDYRLFTNSPEEGGLLLHRETPHCEDKEVTTTKQKLDYVTASLPDPTRYTCDSVTHTITFYINDSPKSYFQPAPADMETTFRKLTRRFAYLTYAYILLNDPQYTKLVYHYNHTDKTRKKASFAYQYDRQEPIFRNIETIFPPSVRAETSGL